MKNKNDEITEGFDSFNKNLQVEIMNQLQPYGIHERLGNLLSEKINRSLKWQLRTQLDMCLIDFKIKKIYV
jgi:hypothetical protein